MKWRSSFNYPEATSNNGMHPTRISVALILNHAGGRVMPGVMLLCILLLAVWM
jgi:hypothetical protein